jgi:hypothetical protein
MAASAVHRFAQAIRKKQDILRGRAAAAGMPSVIKPDIWERARRGYQDRPYSHRERVQNQTEKAGME